MFTRIFAGALLCAFLATPALARPVYRDVGNSMVVATGEDEPSFIERAWSHVSSTPQRTASVLREAAKYMGGNPTGRRSLWCADFANMVLKRTGHRAVASRRARDLIHAGRRISRPVPGAIVILRRGGRGSGHVGFVQGVDRNGNPIVISGNHGHRVGVGVYSRSKVLAYVMPS